MIHSTAVIHPEAELDPTVEVGPYTVIDEGVQIAAGCRIGPHVHLTGSTIIGRNNRFHSGCVIGDAPQDLKYEDAPTQLLIGDGNVFREHATVHRSNTMDDATRIGDGNFLMANCHIAHNARVRDHAIIANGALIAGHVEVGDHAFISGNCVVHQFVRIGTLAMLQGGAGIGMDLPPYTIANRVNAMSGLNLIGLRRSGASRDDIRHLKEAYRILFKRTGTWAQALAEADTQCENPLARLMLEFVKASKRGVCPDAAQKRLADSPRATIAPDLPASITDTKHHPSPSPSQTPQ